jgi:hypothetical protein
MTFLMLKGGYNLNRRPPSSAKAGKVKLVTLYNIKRENAFAGIR